MPLIGINSVQSDPRKPSKLEQIAEGVQIAANVLGTGLNAYKTFGIDRPRAQSEIKESEAKAKLYESQAAKAPEAPSLSDVDKSVVNSYTQNKYRFVTDKNKGPKAVDVYLPDSGKVMHAEPIEDREDTEKKKQRSFDTEFKLRDQFEKDPAVASFQTVHAAASAVDQAFRGKSLDEGNGARDLVLLYNFIKILDPGSLVKEGEIKLSSEASPLAQQWAQQYKRLKDEGGLLPASARKDIIEQVGNVYTARYGDFSRSLDKYRDIVVAYNADPKKVLTEYKPIDFSVYRQIAKEANNPSGTDIAEIKMISPEGDVGFIPAGNVEAAIRRGFKRQ